MQRTQLVRLVVRLVALGSSILLALTLSQSSALADRGPTTGSSHPLITSPINAGNANASVCGINAGVLGHTQQSSICASTAQSSKAGTSGTGNGGALVSAPINAANPSVNAGGINVNIAGSGRQSNTAAPVTQSSTARTSGAPSNHGSVVTAPANAANLNIAAGGINANVGGHTTQSNTGAPVAQSSSARTSESTSAGHGSLVNAPINAGNASVSACGVNAGVLSRGSQSNTCASSTHTSGPTSSGPAANRGSVVSAPINAGNANVSVCGVNVSVLNRGPQTNTCASGTRQSSSASSGSSSRGSLVNAPINAANPNVVVCGINVSVASQGSQGNGCASGTQSGSQTSNAGSRNASTRSGGLVNAPINAANPSVTVCGVDASVLSRGTQSNGCAPASQSSGSSAGTRYGALTNAPVNAVNPGVAVCGVNASVLSRSEQHNSCAAVNQTSSSSTGGTGSNRESLVRAPVNAANPAISVCGINASVLSRGTQNNGCAASNQNSSSTLSGSGNTSGRGGASRPGLINAPVNALNPTLSVCGINVSALSRGNQQNGCSSGAASSTSSSNTDWTGSTSHGASLINAPVNVVNPTVVVCGINASVLSRGSQSNSCAPATSSSSATSGSSSSQSSDSLLQIPVNAVNPTIIICGVNANVASRGTQSNTCSPSASSTAGGSGRNNTLAQIPVNTVNPAIVVCGINAGILASGTQSNGCGTTPGGSNASSGGRNPGTIQVPVTAVNPSIIVCGVNAAILTAGSQANSCSPTGSSSNQGSGSTGSGSTDNGSSGASRGGSGSGTSRDEHPPVSVPGPVSNRTGNLSSVNTGTSHPMTGSSNLGAVAVHSSVTGSTAPATGTGHSPAPVTLANAPAPIQAAPNTGPTNRGTGTNTRTPGARNSRTVRVSSVRQMQTVRTGSSIMRHQSTTARNGTRAVHVQAGGASVSRLTTLPRTGGAMGNAAQSLLSLFALMGLLFLAVGTSLRRSTRQR